MAESQYWKTDNKAGTNMEHLMKELLFDGIINPAWEKMYPGKEASILQVNFDDNPELQRRGGDLLWRTGNTIHPIDIKGQTDMINHPTPTFVLEGASRNKADQYVTGWFLDDSKLTEYYVFVWVHDARHNNVVDLTVNDINLMDCMLINRKNLRKYLENNGLNKEFLQAQVAEFVRRAENGEHGKLEKVLLDKGWGKKVKLVKTPQRNHGWVADPEKVEEPINIVVWKELYADVPGTCYYLFQRQGDSLACTSPIYSKSEVARLTNKYRGQSAAS